MKIYRTALYGMLVALAAIMSYVELLIPFSVGIPGVKPGLANIVIVFALYCMGVRAAGVISLVRVMLIAATFGNAFCLIYSLAGAMLSLAVMVLMKRTKKFSISGVSVAGGVSHNLAQIFVAAAVTKTSGLMYYFPVICVSGIAAGASIGLLAALLTKRLGSFVSQGV